MNRLFIELYLDEDVSVLIADLLRARGFSVTTTQEAGYAVRRKRTLVTHNRDDFERLASEYFSSGLKHYGIIFAVRRSVHEIARRLLTIVDQVTADEMEDQVRHI